MSLNRPRLRKGCRILLVEDDLLIAMDLEELLRDLGCDVIGPCGRLDQALDAASPKLDGAIVDLNLRGEYSFPVIERLQAYGVPTVICSGYVELPEMRARLDGMPVLSKPYNPERLIEVIAESVDTTEPRAQLAAN